MRNFLGTVDMKNVYRLIADVSLELAKEGIEKGRNNQQQNYKFRGIDDVYNALAPVISKHGLVILPRIISRSLAERLSIKGMPIFTVTVEAEFDFVSSHDGSKHTVKTFGEAMDSADKATNKAMSAAYKYAAFQAFCIPTEGDNDADATTHAVKPETKPTNTAKTKPVLTPDNKEEWQKAINSFIENGDLNKVLAYRTISEEHRIQIINEAKKEDVPQ